MNKQRSNDIKHRQFIHSCRKIIYPNSEIVFVRETVEDVNGNIYPTHTIYKNPKRAFWVTKPKYRNHKYKKEYEDISKLDKYIVRNIDMISKIKQIFGIKKRFIKLKQLLNNPYIYGADIDIETLIKIKYLSNYKKGTILPLTIGYLDIETRATKKEITLISYTHENKCYLGLINKFMRNWNKDNTKYTKFTIEDVHKKINEVYLKYIEKYHKIYNFKFFINSFDKDIDCIRWIFNKIHENKTDFIGIWNMPFDIPYIIDVIKSYKIDPESIMCYPEIPKKYRLVEYIIDKAKRQHFTLTWDWLKCTSYSQFYDGMRLNSRIRKFGGFHSTNKLSYMLEKYIGLSKLPLEQEGQHEYMQDYRYMDYILYNAHDSIGPTIMEKKNKDVLTMFISAKNALLSDYSRMIKQLTIDDYIYHLNNNSIIISSMGNRTNYFFDKYYTKVGGAVLSPERINTNVAVDILDREYNGN
jgi:hypothetical protein